MIQEPDDLELSARLDAYIEDLHAGRAPAKGPLLAEHPELTAAVECLEALALLGPPPEDLTVPPANDPERTRLWTAPDRDPATPPSFAPTACSDFGKYELLEEIGRGGMGVVYKARQKDLDRVVALKMILGSFFASEEQVRRFHDEARAAARLHHPHIVCIHEAGQIHGQHYFCMEYVDGTSLAELLRQGPVPVEAAVACLAAVARGVAHLHTQGIVHRDLKPSNVLLDKQGRPFLTDFGLVKMLEADSRQTHSGAVVGTPSYMAPEQAAGRADVGPLSDVYSLGALLYELLTGRVPFRGATPLDTLVQVLEGEATLPRRVRPGVPRELELICLKCLEKTPARRYPSADALADDLERFLRREPVEARPHSLGQHLQRWARREPALLAHLGVLALCVTISHVNFHLSGNVPWSTHLPVLLLLAVWGLVSLFCQGLLRRDRRPELVRPAWLGADAVLLTVVLHTLGALASPLVICYALFVVASGLWFRVGFAHLFPRIAVSPYTMVGGST